jgi:hypothetical protein
MQTLMLCELHDMLMHCEQHTATGQANRETFTVSTFSLGHILPFGVEQHGLRMPTSLCAARLLTMAHKKQLQLSAASTLDRGLLLAQPCKRPGGCVCRLDRAGFFGRCCLLRGARQQAGKGAISRHVSLPAALEHMLVCLVHSSTLLHATAGWVQVESLWKSWTIWDGSPGPTTVGQLTALYRTAVGKPYTLFLAELPQSTLLQALLHNCSWPSHHMMHVVLLFLLQLGRLLIHRLARTCSRCLEATASVAESSTSSA